MWLLIVSLVFLQEIISTTVTQYMAIKIPNVLFIKGFFRGWYIYDEGLCAFVRKV